jgi:preprotein translocase subunit YajC
MKGRSMTIHRNGSLALLTTCLLALMLGAAVPAATAAEGDAPPPPEGRDVPAEPPPQPQAQEGNGQNGQQPQGRQEEQKEEQQEDGEEEDGEEPPPRGCGQGGGFSDMWPFYVMIGAFLLLYIWMGRNRRKQESKRREMLAALKKGDKVTSIGGICGTVVEVREDEVLVKIDDNTRIRMARWAVRGVGEEAKAEKPEEKKQG